MGQSQQTLNFLATSCVTNVLKESLFFCYEGDLPPTEVLYHIGKAWSENDLGRRRSEVAWVEDMIAQYFSWRRIGNLHESSLRVCSHTTNPSINQEGGGTSSACSIWTKHINLKWQSSAHENQNSLYGQWLMCQSHPIRKVRLVHCNHTSTKCHKKGQI